MINIHQYAITVMFVSLILNTVILIGWDEDQAMRSAGQLAQLRGDSYSVLRDKESGTNDDQQQYQKDAINTLAASGRLKKTLTNYLFLPFVIAIHATPGSMEAWAAFILGMLQSAFYLFGIIALWDKFVNKSSNSGG